MQTKIALVLLFSLRTISLAADVTVYDHYDYFFTEPQNRKPVAVSQFPWMFSVHSTVPFIYIFLENTSPSVTATVTCKTDESNFEVEKKTIKNDPRKGGEFYYLPSYQWYKSTELKITLKLYMTNILCSSLVVAEGRAAANITNESMKKKYPYYGTHSYYVLVVDLMKKCVGPPLVTKMTTTTENAVTDVETIDPNNTFTSTSPTNLEITTQKNSAYYDTSPPLVTKMATTTEIAVTDVETIHPNNTFTSNSSTNINTTTYKNSTNDTKNAERHPSQDVLIYVIPCVIGMCVIILVIYLVWIKKCCHRNSPPVQTIELNTSHHEPFYLNILFRRECDREIAELEQNHYEEIGEHIYDEVAPQDTEGG